MSFSKEFNHFVWDDISMSIYAKTARDVERALTKEKPDLEDFKALVSPAAEPSRIDGSKVVCHYP